MIISIRNPRGKRRIRWGVITAAITAIALVGLSLVGLLSMRMGMSTAAAPMPTSSSRSPKTLERSAPVRLDIASIGVDSPLQVLGDNAGKTDMQLPPNPTEAGWYRKGSTPGQAGPTIIVGYIASPTGPGVFQNLAALKMKDRVSLTRTDGKTVDYRVDKMTSYAADQFPATAVYADTPESTLRIITCGGKLDPGQPEGNVVVYAHQIAIRKSATAPASPNSTPDGRPVSSP